MPDTTRARVDLVDLVAGPDVRNASWYLLAREIADLRVSGTYVWADDILEPDATDRRADAARDARAVAGRGGDPAQRANAESEFRCVGIRSPRAMSMYTAHSLSGSR